jgi:membrane fusion protein (multidrug efflux system)
LSQANTKESLASENERSFKLLLQKKPSVKKEYEAVAGLNMPHEASQLITQIAKTQLEPSQRIGFSSQWNLLIPAILVANLVNIES